MKKFMYFLSAFALAAMLFFQVGSCSLDVDPGTCDCETPDFLFIESINPDQVTYIWEDNTFAPSYTFSLLLEKPDGTGFDVVPATVVTDTTITADLTTVPVANEDVLIATVQANCTVTCTSGFRQDETSVRIGTIVTVEEIYPIINSIQNDVCTPPNNCPNVKFVGKNFGGVNTRFNPQSVVYDRNQFCACDLITGNTFEDCLLTTPKSYYPQTDTTSCQ